MRPSSDGDIRIERPDEEQRRLLAATRRDADAGAACRALRAGAGQRHARPARGAGAGRGRGRRRPAAAGDVRPVRSPASLLQRRDERRPSPAECQARLEAARVVVLGVGGLGALGGVGAGLLRGRRDAADRRRPDRAQQPQPAGALRRSRRRPVKGCRSRRSGSPASTRDADGTLRGAAGERRWRSRRRSTATTSSSTPPTGPPTTSSAGSTRPASPPASPTSRQPLPADRADRPDVRARQDRLLRLPGERAPARLPACSTSRSRAPRQTVGPRHARAGLRVDRRPDRHWRSCTT